MKETDKPPKMKPSSSEKTTGIWEFFKTIVTAVFIAVIIRTFAYEPFNIPSGSMIPTKTGAASAVGLVIPEVKGKLDGIAVRVPTNNVSLVDLTIVTEKQTSKDAVNKIMRKASEDNLKGILVYNEEPLVSVDFNHTPASCYFDSTLTKVSADGDLVKVFGWYDNEWGFSCRMLDTAVAMMNAK